MKKINCLIIAALIFSIFANSYVCIATDDSDLKSHKPIMIDGNDEFTEKNGVVSGNGTSDDPYIISNWKIQPWIRTGIVIKNTNAHFIIENCAVIAKNYRVPSGIFLRNVTNGKIKNCTCEKTDFGIGLISSSDNIVENCDFNDCGRGFTINGCPTGGNPKSINNIAYNCYFINCSEGIYFCCLPNSYNNLIESCIFYDNTRGILFDHLSNYIMVTRCNFTKNRIPISFEYTSSNNFVTNNVFYTIKFPAVDNCKNIWDNGPHFGGNYWPEHNSSKPYNISGVGKNKDNYPLDKASFVDQIIAYFKIDKVVPIAGEEILFDGSLSYDDSIVDYEWDFDDGTIKTGMIVNHTYLNNDTYNVTLNVSNGVYNDSFTKTIEVVELSNNILNVLEGESIQNAIDSANPGDSIFVKNATYTENIVVDKPYLSLLGDGFDTIIDGGENGDVVLVTAPFINISDFTIINSSMYSAGIRIGENDYLIDNMGCCISNNQITGNYYGTELAGCKNIEILGNDFNQNSYGVYVNKSHNNLFKSNMFSSNSYGLYLFWGSNWNTIEKNIISESTNEGIKLVWSHYNIITENEIFNNLDGIELEKALSNSVNYNNIYDNRGNGLYFTEDVGKKEFKHNWWGSFFGPSGWLGLRGDTVWGTNEYGFSLLTLRLQRFLICFPWERQKIDFNSD